MILSCLHRIVSNWLIGRYADPGPLPGRYCVKTDGQTPLHEMLNKKHFALEVPQPSDSDIQKLPDADKVLELFLRKDGKTYPKSRVSILLPFFAQHLTDAVFQSSAHYKTDAPHEIILNQIYGNTAQDEKILRSGRDGKLKSQLQDFQGTDRKAEFPPALLEKKDNAWVIKDEYQGLSYLQKPEKVAKLLEKSVGKEESVCAVGLFQGNLTLGNFAITTLLLREHNRLCDEIRKEQARKGKAIDDETIFKLAQQNNITAYMKVVIEDYINAFAGQKLFKLDTCSFFHEKKRWCRETPIPYHFNILYRIHSMIPSTLKGYEEKGFSAFLANNDVVMTEGLGAIFAIASSQAAEQVRLGNTDVALKHIERETITDGRAVLGSFNAHKEINKPGSSFGFDDFDPEYRDELKKLYGHPDNIEYAVGIFAELPKSGLLEWLGIKKEPIIGKTLMNAIARHAFRHILSNRYMSREFLNPDCLTEYGWENLHNTSSVADLVKRNIPEMQKKDADNLHISFDMSS